MFASFSAFSAVLHISTVRPKGVGILPAPVGFSAETTKAAQGIIFPTPPKAKHTSPFQTCESYGFLILWGWRRILLCGSCTLLHRGAWDGNPVRPAFMLLCLVRIFYTILAGYASGFFVLKMALMGCRRLGGPPRLGPVCVSAVGSKAGSEVGFAPWQFCELPSL